MATSAVSAQGGIFTNSTVIRAFGWSNLAVMFVFLINNFITFWLGAPGATFAAGWAGLLQIALYPMAIILAISIVMQTPGHSLRHDSFRISDMNAWFIRSAFWMVFLIGLVDSTISFLRVEDLLQSLVGENLDQQLGRSQFRGPYVHVPLMVLGCVLGSFTRTLGFHWLALLIVIAELLIVILRFIFSYEQAFMADLVRFWYGALFLFASGHTLLEEGHVRVDILYAGMKRRAQGRINALGTVFLGMSLCWMILLLGMSKKTSIINSPILNFETTQSGFGLYVKYMMAGFLAVFAISMMIQFVSYLMGAVADMRDEPGKYQPSGSGAH